MNTNELIGKFNYLIDQEARNIADHIEIKEYDYDELVEDMDSKEDIDDLTFDLKDNKGNYVLTGAMAYEVIVYLDEVDDPSLYTIISVNLNEFADLLTSLVFELLQNQTNFTKEETTEIITHMIGVYYDVFKNVEDLELDDEDDLLVVDLVKHLVENSSPEEMSEYFFDDENFNGAIIINYLDEILDYDNYIANDNKNNDVNYEYVDDVNSYTRKKILSIYDYLLASGYSDPDAVTFMSNYLSKAISLYRINPQFYLDVYPNNEREANFKKYMRYIIVYDFYASASASKEFSDFESEDYMYIKFIDNNPLKDVIDVFKNDESFRKLAINHFNFLNFFGLNNNSDLNDKINSKFEPISTIDKLVRKK